VRIGLLNNLRAGRNDARVRRLLAFLSRHPEVAHVETASAQAVPDALAELAREDVELLVVNGGDGTLQHVLTAMLGDGAFDGRKPLVAPLRGGRTNMTALDLGASRDPVRGMARLIRAVRDGSIEERATLRSVLRVEYGRRFEAAYGMFFGAGTIYRAIELVHRVFPQGRAQGVFGATLTTAALLARAGFGRATDGVLAPDKLQVALDGGTVRGGEFTLAIATTLGRLFAGLRPFWGQGPGNVRFTSLTTGAEGLGRAVPGILAGRPPRLATEERGFTSRNADVADLAMHCGFTVDGELVGPEPDRFVRIRADDRISFVRA
jgi:hypothetical protein